jgi:hypothetical protein
MQALWDHVPRVFKKHRNFPMLLPPGNAFSFLHRNGTFSSYVQPHVCSKFASRGWAIFLKEQILGPGEPQIKNDLRFLSRVLMTIELVTSLFLIQCANMISRLIERRRDVLHYVSRSDPR